MMMRNANVPNGDPVVSSLRACAMIAVALLTLTILSVETINPEIAELWSMNHGVKDLKDLFHKYTNYSGGWYRPSAFFLYYQLITGIVTWYDLRVFQIFTLGLHFLNAYLITVLSSQVFGSCAKERLVLFILVSTNPLSYITLYQADGFDYLYQIFGTSVLISSIALLKGNFVSQHTTLDATFLGLSIAFLFALALTSKEQSISYAMVAAYLVFHFRKSIPSDNFGFRCAFAIAFISIALQVSLWCYYIALRVPPSSGAYRTNLNLTAIGANLNHWFQWSWRLNFVTLHDYSDMHNDVASNVPTLLLLACLLVFLVRTFLLKRSDEKSKVRLVLVAASILSIFPLVFGGFPWHFIAVSNLTAVLLARATVSVIRENAENAFFASTLYWALVIGVLTTAVVGIRLERDTSRAVIVRTIPALLQSTRNFTVQTQRVYYSTGPFGANLWPFSRGNAFSYALRDPAIVAINLPPGEKCNSKAPIGDLCFDYVAVDGHVELVRAAHVGPTIH